MYKLKRAYEPASRTDGTRFLVERLWPRGVKKTDLPLAGWLTGVAPSADLRRWFGHDPSRWGEFKKRYARELDNEPEAWAPIAEAANKGAVTLVFSSRDTEHNAAVALKEYLEAHQAKHRAARAHHRRAA